MPTQQELVALFGEDFNEVLLGLQQLPPEVRELLENTMGKMIYDADVFANRINKTAQTQAAAGIAGTATQGVLATDMLTGGRVFGELRNSIKESLVEGINQSGQAGSFQAYDPDEETLFVWVTVAGHKICADCAPRGGEQRKLREWENEGMPGTGWSVCGGHCYCILDPSGKISPRIKMEERERGLKIQEKGATIRPKVPTPTPAPAVKATALEALFNKFKSRNVKGNQHFADAFKDSSSKFQSVINKFPELRHIIRELEGGYFTEYKNSQFKYISDSDRNYQFRHGGISITTQTKGKLGYVKEYGTIRHEYGHFMHHNLHPYVGKMDEVYQLYHYEMKKGLIVSAKDFADNYNLNKWARDHLKYHEAFFKARHRVGVGSKYKRTNAVMKEALSEYRSMMIEMHNVHYGHFKGGKYFTKDHVLMKALNKDKTGMIGMIQDLFGSLTKNKMGYGHRNSYLAKPTMASHEVFANLTCIYSNKNPIYWDWLKGTLPELTTYYEELIDIIITDGYFGVPMKKGIVGYESFKPPII